jgi:DNA-binding beta-propeller fold protein YncE
VEALMRWTIVVVCLLLCPIDTPCLAQSDFSIKHIFEFGGEGELPGQFRSPLALSIGPQGNIYIADTGNNRIQKFSARGEFLKEVGGFGWATEQFDRPVDICAKTGLDVFVADYNNERIERYDKDFNFISSYYSDESLSEDLQFGFPCAVTISNHGELFIIDGENYRVLKIDSFGEPELSFADYRWADGKLDDPHQIEISSKDIVYVSDRTAHRIAYYDYFGNYNGQFGAEILSAPGGLAVDAEGNIWIADTELHRVVVFDPAGRLLLSWGSEGELSGAFRRPADIAVGDGLVYVLDEGNSRVQVFEIFFR